MSDNKLPWDERVTMLSINPDAATQEDVARMASELSANWMHLYVVRDRLDVLKEHGYIESCDALEILEQNLDAAMAKEEDER